MARAGAVPFWGLLGAVLAIPLLAGPAGAQQPPPQAVRQIETLLAEKAQRTRAQRKVSSQLLDAASKPPAPAATEARGDATDTAVPQERVMVDIRADVTPAVLIRIRELGGTVINSVPRYRSIRAHLPPAAVEPLAKLDAVRTIRPADKARTRGQTSPLPLVARSTVPDTPVTRKDDTSQGDVAHRADSARSTHKVDGTGIGIGVISDGVRSLADRQASGDVPARVTVLPGEEGEGDEGTALLEIVHDLAPGAELYFATGYGGEARMAENIEALCEAGANVIVDDIGYSEEAVFQDGIIAGGVNTAVADGCFFFSAGGNDGNLTNGTSSVWEGDYAAGSTLVVDGETVGVRHDFGGGVEANAVSSYGYGAIVLQWADPLSASTNDYDLFLINDDGDVVESSTNTQDGTQDPIESIPQVDSYGLSVVVVRVSGMDRYLRVQTFGGRLAIATAGNMYGHPAVENAIGVAMVDVRTAAGTGGVFNGNESVRRENSDGPRRIFFQPDGTAITAGNFSSTGGQLLKKPDLAAATCVTTATPGFSTFCGTSSAAPHAAAIAALMLEAAGGPNQVTLAQLRTGMTTGTAVLDIEATGVDRDSGAGIVMAPGAVDAVDAAVADRNRAPTVENAESDRTFTLGGDAVDIDLEDVFDDPDDDTLTYEAISSDPDRLTITRSNAQVTMTPVSPGRVVVRLRAIDPDGLNVTDSFSVTVTAGNRDYDSDNDGLIDVADLAQLDALRYDLNGDGLVDGATWMPYYDAYPMGALGMGCPPTGGCIGYELTANLDFDTDGDGNIDSDDTYWNEGKGWLPIGNSDDPFIVRFYGNGHSLTNLFINRPDEDEIGLFGQLGPVPGLFADEIHSDAGFDILDVGLIGVDISGRDKVGSLVGRADDSETRRSHASGRVAGRDRVGGLVGDSDSGVWESYAAVKVSGRNSVGGLIGSQATIKAANLLNHSRIGSCYATGDVSGANAVGGLVGSSGTSIWAAYATGNVSGTGSRQMGASECELGGGGVGGLVGNACYPRRYGGHIFASYATGMVSGSVGVGGLVGTTHSEVVLRGNYWDMEASGVRVGVGEDDSNENGVIDGTESHSIGLAGQTTAVLQAPTDYEGIYETWNLDVNVDGEPDAPWHFGTSSQYPALTADLNRNRSATWQEFGYQVRGGLTLTAAATEGQAQVVLAWTQVSTSSWSPAPDVTYTLVRDDGTTEEAVEKGATALRYTDTDVTTGATYTYRVTALLDGGEAIRSAPVSVIAGEGNQPPVAVGILEDLFLRVGAGTGTVALSGAFRDPESDTLTYVASSSETAVASVTSSAAQLTITPVAGGRAGITVTATDTAGSNHSATQRFTVTVWPANAVDYDTDDDSLIEIGDLAQLYAVRHDLDGDGTPTARRKNSYDRAFANAVEWMGCSLSVGCRGYELTVDLDFDTNGNGAADAADEYWNGGAGWVPIGGAGSTLDAQAYHVENPFTANFEGNGHTVSHLFIGTDTILLVGLFGFAGPSSNIRNLGLIDADVSGPELAAGLVGLNRGKIRGSYVTGRVSGIHNVGGLVGINNIFAEIRGSYATSQVSGDDDVGGLVGDNRGDIVASYATGRAAGNTDVGGLVGNNKSTGEISAGYATGTVSGGSNVDGLIGLFEGGSINASYWDTRTSGHATGVLPFGRTTAQLQSPRSYSGIYGSWNLDISGDSVNDDPWDFGTSSQYPALRADRNGDGDATWEEFGYQLREGPSLTASRTPGMAQVSLTWTAPVVSHWMPSPTVTYTLTRDDGTTLETLAKDLSGLQYTDTGVTPGATYHYQVAASVSGGEAARSARVSVTVTDNTPPAVSTVAITSDPGTDGIYAADDKIGVTVTFSEPVVVTGRPRLTIEVGGEDRRAEYEIGTGTAALLFAYEVDEDDEDDDGVSIAADQLRLNGGTITDRANNPAVLTHTAVTTQSGHRVDGVRPKLVSTGGAVVEGTRLTLTYDEPLDGSPRPETGDFTVSGGDQARTVTRVSVSGSTVELTLDVGAEHLEAGIQVSYTPGTNPIRDVPGNQAEGLSREPVRNETPDTTPPEVESLSIGSNPGSDQTYAAEDEIEVRVTFSETVKVEGTPQLRLRVGTRTRTAGYESGAGTAVLVFGYEVVEGDEDSDGVGVEAGRISLNGGTIEDEAENAAELDHEALAAQAGHQVDGVRPAFVSAAVDGSSLTLTYGEALDGGSRPAAVDFTVEVGGSGRNVSGVSLSGNAVTLALNPAVEHGDTGIRVSYTPGTNPIRDAVGNQARGLSNRSVTNTTGAPNTAPEITSPSSFDVRENQALARRLAARDSDPGDEVTGWAIVGGADRGQFAITSDTGELSFQAAPDYESPADAASTDPVSGAGDNAYLVTVEVTSGAGTRELEAEQTFTIMVTDEREPPGVPEAPTFSGETADSLRVSWTEPDNTGPPITDYDVQYREKGTGGFTDGDQQGPGRTLTLTDLNPGTVYEVQVRARNDEGTGDWSDPGEGMTVTPLTVVMTSGADPPVSGPFTVRFSFSEPVTGFSRSDIDSSQDPACTDDRNNPVFCDPGIGGLETTDDRVFTATVTPWTDRVAHSYTLRLTVPAGAVRSSVGSKPNEEPEEPLEVRVSPPGVEEPISSIGLQASSDSGSVRLSWNLPSDDGGSAIIRYEYRYAATGEAWSEWENAAAGARSVTVGNLVNGREYVFEVRAVSALGKGGAETVTATPELRVVPPGNGGGGGALLFPPEAPAGLMAMAGDGAVRLEWSPPASDGGTPVLHYEYRLKEGRGEFGEWTPIPDSAPGEVNATGYTVMELGNGTVHVFELRAVNAAGAGQVSEAVEVVMPLDPAYWSNFRAEDLQGARMMLEAFLSSGSSGDRELRFGEELRFEEDELDGEGEVTATRTGGYGYRYTSRTTGVLSLDHDGGEACEVRLTFTGDGEGSYVYRCGGALVGQGSFRLSGLNRVPEITSVGPFEVEENETRAGQVEAVDWDEEDTITGYGITGGADGALFTVEAETGELRFREAPDYENPADVESEDPQSPAADNEYMVVVEVRSGEGERERRREQGIRVRVSDQEQEEAGEEETGEDETGSLFIPVILSSAGRNQSFFTSELTLTNRGEREVRLDYTYTAKDEPGRRSGTASDVLPAGRQKIETDALTYLRGLGVPIPETGNQLGTLRVEVPLGSEVEAVVRTTTVVPEGRAGLAYLGVAEEEGFTEAVYLCGLRQNAQDRSNVAFQNMGASEEGAITLKTTVYSGEAADATARVLKNVKLRPGEFHQYSGLLGSVENGYVKVERVEGRAPFYAYGVINDQANSDGSFVFPVTASSLAGTAGQTLPVIVETSAFRSELTVTNFSEEPRKLDFQFVAEGIETDDKTAAFSMRLEAGQQEIVAEVVEELRRQGVAGLGSTRGFYAGPVFATAEDGDMSGIVIGARTGSKGGGGSYSVFYNAVPFGEAFSREAWVEGLQQNQENRSNLALVNTGEVDGSPSVFHLEIYDGETGLLAETVVTKPVPARSWHQINGILGRSSPETLQGYIRIEKVSGENPFLAYGVVNDGGAPGERSGDGAYLPARE